MPLFVWASISWMTVFLRLLLVAAGLAVRSPMLPAHRAISAPPPPVFSAGPPTAARSGAVPAPVLFFFVRATPKSTILILPGFGMGQARSSRRRQRSPCSASSAWPPPWLAIGGIGFVVWWAHHMYTVGMSSATQLFRCPPPGDRGCRTGVKIFPWIATRWGGPRSSSDGRMLWADRLQSSRHVVASPSSAGQRRRRPRAAGDYTSRAFHVRCCRSAPCCNDLCRPCSYWFPNMRHMYNETTQAALLFHLRRRQSFVLPQHFPRPSGCSALTSTLRRVLGWNLVSSLGPTFRFRLRRPESSSRRYLRFARSIRGRQSGDPAPPAEWTLPRQPPMSTVRQCCPPGAVL